MDDTQPHNNPQGISQGSKKVFKPTKHTPKSLQIIKHYDPMLSPHQNFQKLEDKGIMSRTYGYELLKNSDVLQGDLELVKERVREYFTRQCVPLALKKLKKKLKAEEFPAVSLTVKTHFQQEQPQAGSNTWINIMTGKCEIQTYGKKAAKVGEEGDK